MQGSALECVTHSPDETRALAAKLAAWLISGDIIALNGELGSGKTEFVHGLAQGLEVPAEVPVASPSFALVHEYPGRVLLVHLDLYRLENLPAEMLPDLEEYLAGGRVVAVEWARAWPPCSPPTTWKCGWPSWARPSGSSPSWATAGGDGSWWRSWPRQNSCRRVRPTHHYSVSDCCTIGA